MAKWKGPFTVTKIPNRFQIEYLDGSVTQLTHISYAKKYIERCHYTEQVGIPCQTKGSRRRPRARMARLRLIACTGNRRIRRVVTSIKNIQEKWPVHSGRIHVRILGEAKDLPSDLQAVVEVTGPDNCIEGSVLVDLCRQRSGRRGNGCGAPRTSEELPMPMASSPTPPKLPAVQVRQYSWRHDQRKNECLYDKRREFVGASKQTNHVSLLLPQQAPLVSRAHLMSVVRKVEKSERSKGKLPQDFIIKCLPQNRGKNIMSLLYSRQKSKGEDQQCSVICDNTERRKSEINQLVHVSQYSNNIYTLKPSETRKEQGEVKFKRPGSANCQHTGDVISDGINQGVDVNRPGARKHYAPKKHSFVHTKEFLKSTLSMCRQTFTQMAVMLAVIINILGGGLNMKLPNLICTSGLAWVVCQECESGNNSNSAHPLVAISFLDYPILAILQESTAAIINISKGLCSHIRKVMFLNHSKQLTRCVKVLQDTIIRGVTILPYYYATHAPIPFTRNVSAGKHVDAYIFPSTDFCASRVDYLDTYTVNLESDYNFTVFYNLIYIYTFYHSWMSCNWATYPKVSLYTLVYFSLNWIVSVIRIHDKYQSLILIRLALQKRPVPEFNVYYSTFDRIEEVGDLWCPPGMGV